MDSIPSVNPKQQLHEPQLMRSVLPIMLPPPTLRPVAFRIFTKKHDLTLTSSALNLLADFVGKQCGSAWREKGLAERILEEVARAWKRVCTAVIVEGNAGSFRDILKALEPRVKNGRLEDEIQSQRLGIEAPHQDGQVESLLAPLEDGAANSFRKSKSSTHQTRDPRHWLAVVSAFEQPRLIYNPATNQFRKGPQNISALPDPAEKTAFFRSQYALVHQRVLKSLSSRLAGPSDSASGPSTSGPTPSFSPQSQKLTAIANMLGRGGSRHLMLGLLVLSPTGLLAISDLSGSVSLDLSRATPVPAEGAWFAPGMFVIVEGIYMEEGTAAALAGKEGVGGTIGGKFLGLSIGGPPCERREHTLGFGEPNDDAVRWSESSGGGFGWVDFLGLGSEKSTGTRMRKIERELIRERSGSSNRARIVVIGELALDNPKTLQALRKAIGHYSQGPMAGMPMTFILAGNFAPHTMMASGEKSSRAAYVDHFDSLASVLSEFPAVLRAARFVFVPGDRDPWDSAFSGGAATLLPRKPLPEMFISRIRKVFSAANAEVGPTPECERDGDAVWTTNPSRLSFLGNVQEIVLFRDDISARMRRGSIRFAGAGESGRLPRPAEEVDTSEYPQEHHEYPDLSLDDAPAKVPSSASAGGPETRPSSVSSDLEASRKLVKTLLDQSSLSPFPLQKRPVLWDAAGALRLYPLPTALVLVDPETPTFGITYEACHVMNPGRLVPDGRRNVAKWIEYDILARRSQTIETAF